MLAAMSVHAHKVKDAIRLAWIAGTASRHAPWALPSGEALTAAVADVRDAATDHTGKLRTDLLGQQAGLHQGLALGKANFESASHEAKAALLMEAGADPEIAAEWVPIGLERAKPKPPPSVGRSW